MKRVSVFLKTGTVFFILLVCLTIPIGAKASDDDSVDKALQYLASHQNLSGAIYEEGSSSDRLDLSAWSAMAFTGAGFDIKSIKSDATSKSLEDYITSNVCKESDTVTLERSILALRSADFDLSLLDCNPIATIKAAQHEDGSIDSNIISSVFGLLAFKSAGEEVLPKLLDYVLNSQKDDGGFEPYSPWGTESTFSAQTIQALIGAGVTKDDAHLKLARDYLLTLRSSGGGIKYQSYNSTSNSGSNASVIMALNSLGEGTNGLEWTISNRSLVDDLKSFQNEDGSFKYDNDSLWGNSTPVFSTAYGAVVLALNGKVLSFVGSNLISYNKLESLKETPIATVSPQTLKEDNNQTKIDTKATITNNNFLPAKKTLKANIAQEVPKIQLLTIDAEVTKSPQVLGANIMPPKTQNSNFDRMLIAAGTFLSAFLLFYLAIRYKNA